MIYLLFYDEDNGDRENWNTFYTPVEVFTDPKLREDRKAILLALKPLLHFHELDLVPNPTTPPDLRS